MPIKNTGSIPARGIARVDAIAVAAEAEHNAVMADAVPDAVEAPIEDVVGISPAVETLKATIEEMPKVITEAVDLKTTQTEVKSVMDKAMKSAEDMVSFGQGNMEAMMKASQIWATGLQDLSKTFAASAQAQLDETMASVKALSSVKSLKEAMDLQAAMAKSAMEKAMAETGKFTDASVKLAEQAMAPITARVTLATETFGRAA